MMAMISCSIFAQETADKEAKRILEKMRQQYESYDAVAADFTLTIEIPEMDKEVQEGKIIQKNEQYKLDLPDQAVICDGKVLWLHLKKNKEVQINDVEEEATDILSPKDLLRMYEKDDYYYALTNDDYEGKVAIQQIEFKPSDRDSEIAKLRLTINKSNMQVRRIQAFNKDGSRYTLEVTGFQTNPKVDANTFVFNKADYPGVRVEDLRM